MKPWREALHRDDGLSARLLKPAVGLVIVALIVLVIGSFLAPLVQRLSPPSFVTVYTSQDKVYAEELFRLFRAETGIEVRAVYDSEAVKTVGIVNRLLAERRRPRCDVFWNNEELRTRQLVNEGVLDGSEWMRFGYRSRRLVINTNLLTLADAPKSFNELTNTVWRKRFAMAYPLFGTTATHIMALRPRWGETGWRNWCRALAANEPMIVDGNSVVVRQVGRGEVPLGMTDIDDILAGQREGLPVAAVPISDDAMLIANSVAMVAGAPNREGGARFMAWLLKTETVRRLVAINAIEGVAGEEITESVLNPDWGAVLRDLPETTAELSNTFQRN